MFRNAVTVKSPERERDFNARHSRVKSSTTTIARAIGPFEGQDGASRNLESTAFILDGELQHG
jgi:hypothetical protein